MNFLLFLNFIVVIGYLFLYKFFNFVCLYCFKLSFYKIKLLFELLLINLLLMG